MPERGHVHRGRQDTWSIDHGKGIDERAMARMLQIGFFDQDGNRLFSASALYSTGQPLGRQAPLGELKNPQPRNCPHRSWQIRASMAWASISPAPPLLLRAMASAGGDSGVGGPSDKMGVLVQQGIGQGLEEG